MQQAVAFVLMPFDLLSNWIFLRVIGPALGGAGYVARRADSNLHAVAIMQDVVTGIETADLVIADLTGRNANVFYELGLAHGLNKPVLMIARASGDIPFDLSAYRTIIYSVDLPSDKGSDIASTLQQELALRLEVIRAGEMVFTSPFTDYKATPTKLAPTAGLLDDARALRDNVAPYLTIIDRLVAMMNAMTTSMAESRTDSVGDSLDDAAASYASYAPAWLEAAQGFENLVHEELLPRTLVVERGALAFLRLEEDFWKDTSSKEAYLASVDEVSQAAAEYVPMFRELAETVRTYGRLTGPLIEPGSRLGAALDQVANLFGDVASLASRLRDNLDPSG